MPVPQLVRMGGYAGDHPELCSYADALAMMDGLVSRPASAPDVILALQHPPTLTLGRRGGREHIHDTVLRVPGHEPYLVELFEIARGGSVTFHAPGQLVIYPIVQLAQIEGPLGHGPLGDLPKFLRLLETAMQQACLVFGLKTQTRPGFAGLWLDDTHKLGSVGVALRNGWTFHGLAINVCPREEGFALLTPCGLDGVRLTTLWKELQIRGLPLPSVEQVEREIVGVLQAQLRRGCISEKGHLPFTR